MTEHLYSKKKASSLRLCNYLIHCLDTTLTCVNKDSQEIIAPNIDTLTKHKKADRRNKPLVTGGKKEAKLQRLFLGNSANENDVSLSNCAAGTIIVCVAAHFLVLQRVPCNPKNG